jgi:hypothetical protein
MPPPTADDTPGDGGGSITVRWEPPAREAGLEAFRVERATAGEDFEEIGRVSADVTTYADEAAQDGVSYQYRVAAVYAETTYVSGASHEVSSSPQWFNTEKLNVLVGVVLFCSIVLWFISRAKKGIHLYVRRIAGLEAVDEAVGRATEMGREILYVPGTGYVEDIATIASMNLLAEIAKKAATYGTKLRVPNRDPIVYTVAREVVKGAFAEAGRPDAFDSETVFFVVRNALAYAAAVDGIMLREKPATNFFMGMFAAESLILAETGSTTGAIQIAGTDAVTQLPFFVTTCDYTLIGEELYAASAYISREPLMLGALKGQDWGKFIIMTLLVLMSAAALVFRAPVTGLFD